MEGASGYIGLRVKNQLQDNWFSRLFGLGLGSRYCDKRQLYIIGSNGFKYQLYFSLVRYTKSHIMRYKRLDTLIRYVGED